MHVADRRHHDVPVGADRHRPRVADVDPQLAQAHTQEGHADRFAQQKAAHRFEQLAEGLR